MSEKEKPTEEYIVNAHITLTCNISVEAEDEKSAKEEAMGYFEVSANLESDYYCNICVIDIEIDDVNQ